MEKLALALAFAASLAAFASGQAPKQAELKVESNVVYGMYSGAALLMDVHYPESKNGYGIVYIPGTGFRGC